MAGAEVVCGKVHTVAEHLLVALMEMKGNRVTEKQAWVAVTVVQAALGTMGTEVVAQQVLLVTAFTHSVEAVVVEAVAPCVESLAVEVGVPTWVDING